LTSTERCTYLSELVSFENQTESPSDLVSITQVRVYLAFQNRLLREALVRLIRKRTDLLVVGQGAPANTRPAAVLESQCDILLLDSLHAVPESAELTAWEPLAGSVKTILIGMDADEKQFLTAVRAGIMGYLLKDASTSDVIAAVRTVSRGEVVCPTRLCSVLFRFVAQAPEPFQRNVKLDLTLRQQQLASLVAKGLTNKEIASQLNLSEFTVRNHIHRILKQVDAENRSQAVETIRSHGYSLSQ
jgi:DNA-binding NarL/FixJ family response regulator